MFDLPNDGKGIAHDVARSSEDWAYFRTYHKEHNPIRYWLHNDAASLLIWPWSMRIARVNDWIRYRTYNRYHVVKTGMEPGYVDVTERMLHVNFNMLKDFVEIEKAHMWKWSENSLMEQPGVSHLIWEMGLEGGQAENAREIYELYDWWTNDREYREDADKDWDAYHDAMIKEHGEDSFFTEDNTKELTKLRDKWLKTSSKLEKKYTKQDEQMLIRLMKIRNALWT